MKSFLLCGIAIASVLMLQPAPASAQRVHGAGQARMGHSYAGHGAGRFQYHHRGYARGYGPGYGIGVGAAAVATGALIGGAIATQNQGYNYPDQNYPGYTNQYYPGYSSPGYVYSDASLAAYNNGDSSRTANRLTDHTTPPVGAISATTGFDMLAHDWL
jgi:hypothetical protein